MSDVTHHQILGVRLDDLSLSDLKTTLRTWLDSSTARIIVTPNPEFLLLTRKDQDFKRLLNEADLSLPDGIGLKFAVAALSNERLKYRHTGADTLLLLAELCHASQARLVLLGGSPKKTGRATDYLRQTFPGLDVASFDPGIIDNQNVRLSEATLAGVERLAPQVLAVALGQGKQEKVMNILKQRIPGLRILIGIGGASDYVSQAVSRAPQSWRRFGFEWLWRLFQEPWRWKRIIGAVVLFPILVAWTSLKSGRLISACKKVFKEVRMHFAEPS